MKNLIGIPFGFWVLIIWLSILTGFFIGDKMKTAKVDTIILPPQLEVIGEVDF